MFLKGENISCLKAKEILLKNTVTLTYNIDYFKEIKHNCLNVNFNPWLLCKGKCYLLDIILPLLLYKINMVS